MALASASLGSLESTAHYLRAPHLALEMANVSLSERKCPANVMRGTKGTIALRRHAQMIALDTASVSMVLVLVRMGGVVMIVQAAAQDMAIVAAVMESALRASAIAIRGGLVMLAIFVLACMIARNMATATMGRACAKKVTGVGIAPCQQSPSHASVPSTACVGAFSNAPKCTRPKVLDLRMSATPSAPKNVCLSVSPARCL